MTHLRYCTASIAVMLGLILVPMGLASSPAAATVVPPVWSAPTTIGGVANNGYLYGISCASAGNCTAVGRAGSTVQSIGVDEIDGVWDNPVIIDNGVLSGVSCTSPGTCVGVGLNAGNGVLVEETNYTWNTNQALGDGSSFYSVSCTSATNCVAINDDGFLVETNGSWSGQVMWPGSGDFFSVSCGSATTCVAVGGPFNGSRAATLSTAAGGSITSSTDFTGIAAGGELNGVSCTTATDCTAVGQDANGHLMAIVLANGTWGTPTDLGAGYGILYGVSCTTATDCTAVGLDSNGRPMAITEDQGVWLEPVALDGLSGGQEFWSVSCVHAQTCTGAGDSNSHGDVYVVDQTPGVAPTTLPPTTVATTSPSTAPSTAPSTTTAGRLATTGASSRSELLLGVLLLGAGGLLLRRPRTRRA